MKNNKGVTLIELLIVIGIIGILAAIAIPGYIGQQKRAVRAEAYTNLESLRLLEEQFYAERSCYYCTGSPCVCTNATITGVTNIQAFLPGFQPGTSLNFTYQIQFTGTSAASCFTATATGSSSRVTGDTFTIDCNNTKSF